MLFAVLLLVAAVQSASLYDKRSAVVTIRSETFHQVNRANDISVVQFYSPGCFKCQQIKKEFEKAAKQMIGLVTFAAIDIGSDVTEGTFFSEQHGIDGNSVKVLKGGQFVDYDGEQTAKAMTSFVYELVEPEVQTLTSKAHKKFLKKHDHSMPKVLFFSKSSDPDVDRLYDLLSMKYKGRMAFASVNKKQKKVVKKYDFVEYPTILALPAWDGDADFDAPQRTYNGKLKGFSLSSFLELYALPPAEYEMALPELKDDSCMQALCIARGGLCAIALLSSYDQAQLHYNLRVMRQTELRRRDSLYSFTWLDSVDQMEFLGSAFGLTPQDYPQVVVFSPSKLRYTLFVGSFNSEDLSVFLSKVHKGSIKTDPIFSVELPTLAGDTEQCAGMVTDSSFTDSTPQDQGQDQPQETTKMVHRLKRGGKKGKLHELSGSLTDVVETAGSWLVLFAEDTEANQELITNFKKAAIGSKNLVTFGHWDLGDNAEKPFLATMAVTDGSIFVFRAGTDKASTWEVYTGPTDAKSLNSHAMSLLTPELITHVQSDHELNQWLSMHPLQPKLLLVTEKAEAPKLICALADEFDRLVSVGYTHPDAMVAQQLGVEDSPSLIFLQGEMGDLVEGTKQHQVGISTQEFPKDQLYYSSIARQLDQLRQGFPSRRQATQQPHDEL